MGNLTILTGPCSLRKLLVPLVYPSYIPTNPMKSHNLTMIIMKITQIHWEIVRHYQRLSPNQPSKLASRSQKNPLAGVAPPRKSLRKRKRLLVTAATPATDGGMVGGCWSSDENGQLGDAVSWMMHTNIKHQGGFLSHCTVHRGIQLLRWFWGLNAVYFPSGKPT